MTFDLDLFKMFLPEDPGSPNLGTAHLVGFCRAGDPGCPNSEP